MLVSRSTFPFSCRRDCGRRTANRSRVCVRCLKKEAADATLARILFNREPLKESNR